MENLLVKTHKFGTCLEAWEGMNEYFLLNEEEIKARGGGKYGPELLSYNHLIHIERAYIPPEFDFNKVLGYHQQKWSKLINNYINLNFLDMVRDEVCVRETKKSKPARSYNYPYLFDNSQGSGKGCLLSLVFSRTLKHDDPLITFSTRVTELTKRFIFDLLLIQRMGEYVYGDTPFSIQCFFPSCYIAAESVILYHMHKNLKKVIKKDNRPPGAYRTRVLHILKDFQTKDVEAIKYKVHKRSAMQVQGLNNVKPLLVKNCKIYDDIDYPDDAITMRSRNSIRKQDKLKKK